MNPTITKFGWPQTQVAEFEHWVVLGRPAQPTLGALVLAAKYGATAFADLPAEAHAELKQATTAIERALKTVCGYEKINYLMLMMVDHEVHFHVIPRYEGAREWHGLSFPDAGWPKVPDLSKAVALEGETLAALTAHIKAAFA